MATRGPIVGPKGAENGQKPKLKNWVFLTPCYTPSGSPCWSVELGARKAGGVRDGRARTSFRSACYGGREAAARGLIMGPKGAENGQKPNQENVDFERRGTTDSLPVEELLGLENPGFPQDSPGQALQSTPPA